MLIYDVCLHDVCLYDVRLTAWRRFRIRCKATCERDRREFALNHLECLAREPLSLVIALMDVTASAVYGICI